MVDPKPKLVVGLFGAGVVEPGAAEVVVGLKLNPPSPWFELPVEAPNKLAEGACVEVAEGADVVAPPNKPDVPGAEVVAGFCPKLKAGVVFALEVEVAAPSKIPPEFPALLDPNVVGVDAPPNNDSFCSGADAVCPPNKLPPVEVGVFCVPAEPNKEPC